MPVPRAFKNFLMHGDLVVIALGVMTAIAFNTVVKTFTDTIVTPLLNAAGGGGTSGLGFHVGGELVNVAGFVSVLVYLILFAAVVYFLIVLPYRRTHARRGRLVFGEPGATRSCPECLCDDLPAAATRCKYCGTASPAKLAA